MFALMGILIVPKQQQEEEEQRCQVGMLVCIPSLGYSLVHEQRSLLVRCASLLMGF